MTAVNQDLKRQAERLYDQYARPLEPAHAGEYVAISAEGKTVLGTTLADLLQEARSTLGPGSFVFKVGERAVWKWR